MRSERRPSLPKLLLASALLVLAPRVAGAVELTFDTPISGDVVQVTLSLADAPVGDRVDITVSIPQGEGDLLGLFGNVVDESLVPQMAVDDPSGLITQWQFQANQVWKVGGGNTMAPVKKWDWGLKIDQTGSSGGMITSASFALTGPGLTVAQLVGAVNQGWVFGVRIQSTNGSEGSSKMGLSGDAPRIQIEEPPDGALLNQTPTSVSGTVLGTGVAVDVNGVPASVASTAFDADVPLVEGPNTLTATASNAQGTATDSVDVVLDTTPPVVTITDPPDATLTADAQVLVTGTVTDASAIASVTVNGQAVTLAGGQFQATLSLALGDNPITAEATDAAGNTGSDAITVVRGEPPVLAITSPLAGTLVAPGLVTVAGTVTGIPEPNVVVNGIAASVSGGAFSVDVPVSAGANTLTAAATNALGSDSDQVLVTAGVAPGIQITNPADGALLEPGVVAVSGTVTGVPEPSVVVNGVGATVAAGSFSAAVPVAEGPNTLTATASNAFGSDAASVAVTAGFPPTIQITAPADGLLTNQSPIAVSGSVTGTSPVSVEVNGVAATVAGGSFSASVPLTEGANTLTATASNLFGSDAAAVGVTLDTTPPVVTISSPADGAEFTEQPIGVFGTVADASPIVDLRINGDPIAPATAFATTAALVDGSNTITMAASDAAGNTGSASVTVTLTSAGEPLAIQITSPPGGALVSDPTLAVTGTVSDAAASVVVNGVAAAVTGSQWVAGAVPLAEGPNDLVATATRASESANDQVQVVLNEPPGIVITSPLEGAVLNLAQTDVEGVVDDPTAFVDLNGVAAQVDSGGRWIARDVPLAVGSNPLQARAVDPLGAVGRDEVEVTRDDAAAPPLRVVLTHSTRFASVDNFAGTVGFSNDPEWRDALTRLGLPPASFDPPLGQATVENQVMAFVLTDDPGVIPTLDVAFLGPPPLPDDDECQVPDPDPDECAPLPVDFNVQLRVSGPIEDVETTDPFLNNLLNPEVLAPADFAPDFFFAFDVTQLPFGEGDPPGTGPVTILAGQGTAADTVDVQWDEKRPRISFVSPPFGSTLGGDTVTVTGTVEEQGSSLLGEVEYELSVLQGFFFVVIAEGTAPVADGRFTIPDLGVGDGTHEIQVTARDAAGNTRTEFLSFTVDSTAPAAALIFPQDGQALAVASTPIDLNFASTTTLVSVNGVPDGRVFGPGLAAGVLDVPLSLGANAFFLDLDSGGQSFGLGFTLFGVETLAPIRITSPADGAFTNQESLPVQGVAPVGTPFVEVNGIAASLAPDGSFEADVPIEPGRNTLRAVGVFGDPGVVEVTGDFEPPELLLAIPEDGTFTPETLLALSGLAGETARLELTGPGGAVFGRTRSNPFEGGLGLGRAAFGFDLPALDLMDGANALGLTLTDRAGNSTLEDLTVTRTDGAVQLVSPPDGAQVATAATTLSFQVLEDVLVDALYSAGRRIPGFEGAGLQAPTSSLGGVPLAPGPNPYRLVYTRAGGAQEVLNFSLDSTSADFASVSGTVTDAQTGAPIDGALVMLTDTGSGLSFVVVTGPDGSYSAAAAPGTIDVAVVSEGFAPTSLTVAPATGEALTQDVALDPTGIPALMNEVAILVPPDGTVTDFEKLTVVGTVFNPASTVTVNGIPAEVLGNRFTAKSVPLAMGPNTIQVSASALVTPAASTSVQVERADEPVLDVVIYSPPAGATVPGSGLVVRGFVSARRAITLASGSFAPVSEGVFAVPDLLVDPSMASVGAVARLSDRSAEAQDEAAISVTSAEPAFTLDADPAFGVVPFDATLQLFAGSEQVVIERLDFDLDGDLNPDIVDAATAGVTASYAEARPVVARALVTTPSGVEFSAPAVIRANLPTVTLGEFAQGNPVDLAPAPAAGVYVLDSAAGSVSRYDADRQLQETFGSAGAGPDQLLNPEALAVAGDGRIFVADTGNHRIQVFLPDGTHETTLTQPGLLSTPRGIAVVGDRVFVSDSGNGRLAILSDTGSLLLSVPLAQPRGLDAEFASGTLVSSPSQGVRALVQRGSTVAFVPAFGDAVLPAGAGTVAPVDVAVGDDSTFVSDAAAPRVLVLTPAGALRRTVDGLDAAPRAVLPSLRRELESFYVADGEKVVEIGMPVESPIPVLESLKDRLSSGDIDGALSLIDPMRRASFGELYLDIEPDLPIDAAAMTLFRIDLLREDRAIVDIVADDNIDGVIEVRRSPAHLVRTEDGAWQLFSY